MEEHFERSVTALDSIFSFVERFAVASNLDEATVFSATLAAEELFTNLVRHNVGGAEYIAIHLDVENGRFVIRLSDFDVDRVELSGELPPEVYLPLAQRTPGGLGIRLVRSMFDSLTYEYRDRTLYVTAVKNLEDVHV